MRRRIGIAGSGAWGRALAHVAGAAGHQVALWSRALPASLANCDAIIVAVPAQAVRDVLIAIRPDLHKNQPIIIGAKGIEQATGLFMNGVVSEILPGARVLVLSGPSFAADVMGGLPTAVVLAGPTLAEAGEWAEALSLPAFRIYNSDDVLGVEVGGALKNVLAIACGISDGRGLGDSARAALTTRGFAELMRFGRKLGAKPETLIGLSGLGDLLLTCASPQSRNYAFGLAIGQGRSVAAALAQSRGVVEGASTVRIAHELARRHQVDMPIVAAVHAIVDESAQPAREIARLLARPAGQEIR
ncbi:MAG: NAD(P)-dependent glycerol-3-phosphate dehydrogenase [Rhizobiales bacterium]|nr:NAD(P)-dependent glycerol-3-phosphate dehydrogenase [Hyphomicrobiales bacterium]MBI3671839.1 NAD(P)-dependent glycerol-3-phosphate dehydrogenase [Hyphomicrobiales bacterium]